MLLLQLFQDPAAFLAFLIALVVGISVHEAAHAWVADRLGDPTARYAGRVTLSPLAHLDLLGTILLFVAGFGWGRPVPINPQYFARPIVDELLVALAGPASNLLVAALLALTLRSLGSVGPTADTILLMVIQINIILMLFNLIPIPPLDGSKVLQVFLGPTAYQLVQAASLPLIFLLLLLLQGGLGSLLGGLVERLTAFLLGIG